jgi:hypothetical protein
MQSEINDSVGVFFFLAAKKGDLRQFAVTLKDGKPDNPVYAFEPGKRVSGFRAGETVFALSESTPEGVEFPAKLLRVEADRAGRPQPQEAIDVRYGLHISKQNGKFSLLYRLTPESRATLDGGLPDYVKEFSRSAKDLDPAMLARGSITPRMLAALPLPPHHAAPLAETARREFENGRAPPPLRLDDSDDWEMPARLEMPGGEQGRDIVIVPSLPPGLRKPPGN